MEMRPLARQERAEQTDLKIREAFTQLLKTKSIQEVSIKSICELAGVSVGAFYYNYKSKDELIVRLLLGTRGGFDQTIRARLTDDAMHNVRVFLFTHGEMCSRIDIGFLRELYTAHIHYGDQIDRITDSSAYHLLCEIIQDGQNKAQIRTDISHTQLADLIMMAWEGYLYHWCCNGGSYSLTEFLSARIDTIIRILKQ